MTFLQPPTARAAVECLHAYNAPLEGRRGLLRLDFNENTLGASPKVVEALRAIPADHIAIYPEYNGLREALITNLAQPRLDGSLERAEGRRAMAHPLQPE